MMHTDDDEPLDLYLCAGLVRGIVFTCLGCGARRLGPGRCGTEGCHSICQSFGIGGLCPCCNQPVAFRDLVGREMKLILAQ